MWNTSGLGAGIIIGTLGIGLATYFYFKNKIRRRLNVTLEYYYSLVEIKEEIKKDIEIYFKGAIIDNIAKSRLRIINTGNREIENQHIIKPVVFSFPKNRVIAFSVTAKPESFEPKFVLTKEDPSYLVFEPNYMEKSDEAVLDVLTLGPQGKPEVSGELGPPRFNCFISEGYDYPRKRVAIIHLINGIIAGAVSIFLTSSIIQTARYTVLQTIIIVLIVLVGVLTLGFTLSLAIEKLFDILISLRKKRGNIAS